MYQSLCEQYHLSQHAIWDLRDQEEFEELVQGLLHANYGMNWESWWELVEWNVKHRIEGNRMDVKEEREIVLRILEDWLEREEVGKLKDVKGQVILLKNYLIDIKLE